MGVNAVSSSSGIVNNSASSASSLDMDDFLNLLVAQLKNQDAMNPMDNTQFISQLAQFSSLKAMTEMSEITKQTQATSLIGKTVAMASYDDSGNVVTTEGKVEKVTIYGGETNIYVNGEAFKYSNLMEIKADPEEAALETVLQAEAGALQTAE